MKRFIIKILVFLFIFSFSFLSIFVIDYSIIGNQYTSDYCASLIDKSKRLNSIDEPKIILIGNSNVAFGFDSQLIEKEIGMPVVNMGLHGNLGNAFHEQMAKINTTEGDIVVICHSDYSDDDKISDSGLALITLEKNFELYKLIRLKDVPGLLQSYPRYFVKSAMRFVKKADLPTSSYSRSSFNEYGDIIYRGENTFKFSENTVRVPEINDICINRLNELNQYINSKGAIMITAGYPIGYGEFTPSAEEYELFEEELREKLDCDVISHFTDYYIPYDKFYDTYLHLNDEGVKIRTEQFIDDLKNWMDKKDFE